MEVLGVEPWTWVILRMCSTTEVYPPRPLQNVLKAQRRGRTSCWRATLHLGVALRLCAHIQVLPRSAFKRLMRRQVCHRGGELDKGLQEHTEVFGTHTYIQTLPSYSSGDFLVGG